MISETTIRYAASGVDDIVDAERRVRGAISETAHTAARDEAKTKRWMEQHKTALLAIGAATGAAMAAIIASSPSLSASLGEVHLWFSMLAMVMGENVAPVFETLAGLSERLYDAFTELPKPVQTLISYIALLAIGLGIIVPLVAGLIWSFGLIKAAFVGLSMPALVVGGVLTTLGLIVGILGGLVLGGVVVWGLWKLGVIQAVEDAGASVGRFAYNAGVVVGNLSRNIIDGLKLLASSAAVYGADFALSWADGVAKNIPIVGARISEMIGSVRSLLDGAKTDLAAQWDDFDLTGGLTVGMQVGPPTPNRTISDMIGGADTAVFGGVDTSSSQAELQKLQDLMQEFNSTMPSETAAAAADTNAALSGLDTGLSTTATNVTATKTELERLQAVMSGFNARTPGLSQTADAAKSTGDAVKSTATETATAAADVNDSLASMDSGFSNTSVSVTATTAAMATTVSGQFDTVALSGGRWGSDLMGRFISGLNSRQGELAAKLAAIRASIESALSFDIRSNDLAAERWGRDLGMHFAAGLSGEIGTVAGVSGGYRAAAMPSPMVSSSSSSTSVNLGGVSVNISGADAGKLDEVKLARLITQQVKTEVASAVRGRAR